MVRLLVENSYVRVLKEYPILYGKAAGFEDLTRIHNEWLKTFLTEGKDYTLQAHRGSYKTTTLALAIALLMIIEPGKSIIFVRKADNDVKEVINLVGKLLRERQIVSLSEEVMGRRVEVEKESASEINTNLNINPSGASQLIGVGSKASLTGKHADIVITDDIINIDDRISRAHRDRTKYTYQELQNVKNRGGRFINTGTPWHKDDAFKLMGKIERYDYSSTGLISKEEIEDLKESMSPSLFSANYELRHIAEGDRIFKNPRIARSKDTRLIFNGYAHVDASYGGKDRTALTIMKRAEDGSIYVYGKLWEDGITSDGIIEEIEDKRLIYRAGNLYMERNADKGVIADDYIKDPTETYHESMNKHIKITTYLRKEWKNIIFIDGTDREYINEIIEYNDNSPHDDAPDSLASLIRETEEEEDSGMQFFGI